MMEPFKYPRIPHLPWSPGATGDDERIAGSHAFAGKRVVVTEKLDGENTAIYHDRVHARSTDGRGHPSRDYVRALGAVLGSSLPEGVRLAGENLYAVHSIRYEALPDWFVLFGVHVLEEGRVRCTSWDAVEVWAGRLGLVLAPVLYRGLWSEAEVRACWTSASRFGGEQEGYVVRLEDGFFLEDHGENVAKYVRADHVQTDEHWMTKAVEVNGLAQKKED